MTVLQDRVLVVRDTQCSIPQRSDPSPSSSLAEYYGETIFPDIAQVLLPPVGLLSPPPFVLLRQKSPLGLSAFGHVHSLSLWVRWPLPSHLLSSSCDFLHSGVNASIFSFCSPASCLSYIPSHFTLKAKYRILKMDHWTFSFSQHQIPC